ncbi:MAG: TRAM domain-containing protein [Phycisphaerales bacterium]
MPTEPTAKREFEAQARQRDALVNLLRAILIILMAVFGALGLVDSRGDQGDNIGFVRFWWVGLIAIAIYFVIVVGIDHLTPRRKLSTISGILFGTFAGIIATLLVSGIIDLLTNTYLDPEVLSDLSRYILTAKVILGLGLCYLGVTTVLQTQDDFRLVIPYVEFAKQFRGTKPLLVDTSILVDGRLHDVASAAIFQAPFIVPRFVIDELQQLSDSNDKLKRARGRRGLDMLARMQKSPDINLTVDEFPVPGSDTDQMLVELAQQLPAIVVTTDVGLARVAAVHDVAVLNINDLANALKPNVLPGEALEVTLIKKGEQHGQGVGYLEDGTMVVAENGGDEIGNRVTLTVTSAMQTSAGRLIFGRIGEDAQGSDRARSRGSEPFRSADPRSEEPSSRRNR